MSAASQSPYLARLLSGKGQIFSHDGTSQYSQGSPSGCGLAAFNCTRILFEWDRANCTTEEIINKISLKSTALDIVSLCSLARIPQHMEPEDFISLPLFQAGLSLLSTEYCVPAVDRIENVLLRMNEFDFEESTNRRRICAVVITRPPEIVVCFKIPHPTRDIYALFDSHSRPRHPMGSAFVCTPDMSHLVRYIHELLKVDEGLINGNADIGWEGQLLASMSGHYFVPAEIDFTITPMAFQILLDATTKQLELQASAKDNSGTTVENVHRAERDISARLAQLQNELEAMRLQSEELRVENNRLLAETRGVTVTHLAIIGAQRPPMADRYGSRTESPYRQLGIREAGEGEGEMSLEVQRQIEAQIEASRSNVGPRRNNSDAGYRQGGALNRDRFDDFSPNQRNGYYDQGFQRQIDNRMPTPPRRTPINNHSGHDHGAYREPNDYRPAPVFRSEVSGRVRSPIGGYHDANDVDPDTLEMQRRVEMEARNRTRQRPASPVRHAPPASSAEERYRRAEEMERTREERRVADAHNADAAAAAALQRQFEEEDERLRREHEDLLNNAQKTFECSICMDEHPEDDLAAVEMCGHKFGRECLRDFIVSKVDQRSYPIVCPICIAEQNRDGGREKVGTISNTLAEMVGIEEEKYNTFVECQLASLAVQITCKKCEQQFFFDRDQFQEKNVVECLLPNCDYRWCKMCNQEVPLGTGEEGEEEHSCDGSKELDRLLEGQGWKRCPGCQTPIERTHGCNHMTCRTPGCNMHFCYKCGSTIGRADPGVDINPAYRRHYESCPLFT